MVKFSKELEAQLIPEWKDAFVNYWQLKKQIKKIKLARKPKPSSRFPDTNGGFGRSVFDPVRFVIHIISEKFSRTDQKPEIIRVKTQNMEDRNDVEIYHTELFHLFSQEDEVKVFFARLDEELNKVNQFYKQKENEFIKRGEHLNRELEFLTMVEQKLHEERRKNKSESVFRSLSSSARHYDISENEISAGGNGAPATEIGKNGVSFVNAGTTTTTRNKTKKGKPTAGTITAVASSLLEDLMNSHKSNGGDYFINRKKFQCAEKVIRSAFVELYRGLGLLKTYSSLNMVAFTKILKKFDKVSDQNASSSYLKAVKNSNFISSVKVVRLMDEVEIIFTERFANNDRKKAMKFLRPQPPKDSQTVTFFVGCLLSLFGVYAILANLSGVFSSVTETAYVQTIYPVFSVFALWSLHMLMYGCNLWMWKNTRINHCFIFEFQPKTALRYGDALLISTTFMTAVVAAMVVHLLLRAAAFSPGQVDVLPGVILLIFICLLICPFDIMYRPTRYYFIRIIRKIICSPFYKVLLVDIFMADQLTSQIPLLRHLESTGCYFMSRSFKTHDYETCKNGRIYRELAYIISFSPYFWRAMQCMRRWWDESNPDHLTNMGKYLSAMAAAGVRITYARESTDLWFAIVLISSIVATVYQLYWDFVKDWGLFKPNSIYPWLRDDLILKNKNIYYLSIALNFVLRVAWIETVMRFRISPVQSHMLDFFLASLEVIRRGHWNFYRLENEHLNNVGQFRAIKTVPLPFRKMDNLGNH